jgi:GT2 family glycosyltransferase
MWYEDVDLSFRAQLAGYKCMYVPTAVVYHVSGGTASSSNKLHIRYCTRNQVLVMVKNLPGPLRSRYFVRLAAVCLKHSLKTLLQGQTTVSAGYLMALKDLRRFIKKYKLNPELSDSYISYIADLLALDSGETASLDERFG